MGCNRRLRQSPVRRDETFRLIPSRQLPRFSVLGAEWSAALASNTRLDRGDSSRRPTARCRSWCKLAIEGVVRGRLTRKPTPYELVVAVVIVAHGIDVPED